MSIPLLRFPVLALDQILKNMQYSEIFNVSICSERMHRLVQRIKFKQIAKICYYFQNRTMYVGVEDHSGKRHFLVGTAYDEDVILNTYEYKIGGIKNRFKIYRDIGKTNACFALNEYHFFFLHNMHSEPSVKRSVISHCSRLFQRHPPIVQLRLRVDPSLGPVPILEGVREMCMFGEGISVQYATVYYPNLTCLRIYGKCGDGERFSGVDNLFLDQAGLISNVVVQTFTGRYLYMFNAPMSTNDLLEICRSWQWNEICRNLRFLYIDLTASAPTFDPQRFFAQLETQEWDPNVRPGGRFRDFPFMIDVPRFPNFNTNEFRDFQRADGKWASLRVLETQFFLIVWD